MTASMPPWLRRHLEQAGAISETGLTVTARPRRCRRCGAVTLAAIDSDGLDARCDPHPLDAQAEAAALLAGIPTWWVHARRELVRRDLTSLQARPAGSDPDRPVLAEHRCDDVEEGSR